MSSFNWDPGNIEIRTKSMQINLEPLVINIRKLINHNRVVVLKRRSEKSQIVLEDIRRAVITFIDIGEQIAKDNPNFESELLECIDQVELSGQNLSSRAEQFSMNPLDLRLRAEMVEAARSVLSFVTKLLLFADFIDVHNLLNSIAEAEKMLRRLKSCKSDNLELHKHFSSMSELILDKSESRQNDFLDSGDKRCLAEARDIFSESYCLLFSVENELSHISTTADKERTFAFGQMEESLAILKAAIQGSNKNIGNQRKENREGVSGLLIALDKFDELIVTDPGTYDEAQMRPSWEETLENIVSGAALVADRASTRPEVGHQIVMEGNNVRQALQELLETYPAMRQGGRELDTALEAVMRRTRDFRRQLRKADKTDILDNLSEDDSKSDFPERANEQDLVENGQMTPLDLLIMAAQKGDEIQVEHCTEAFTAHALKLMEVAQLAVSMSEDQAGVTLVTGAAEELGDLQRMVITAARSLAVNTDRPEARENLVTVRKSWLEAVVVLTEAVDSIVTIDDFLTVSESHVLEDVKEVFMAVEERDLVTLADISSSIQARVQRITEVVRAEMERFELSDYKETVIKAVNTLEKVTVKNFSANIQMIMENFQSSLEINEADLLGYLDTCQLVCEGVRNVRCAVILRESSDSGESESLENETLQETEDQKQVENLCVIESGEPSLYSEEELELILKEETHPTLVVPEDDFTPLIDVQEFGMRTAVDTLRSLSKEEKNLVNEKVEEFEVEKEKFSLEISKWMEEGNELVRLAQAMSDILTTMTDFIGGEGPLMTNMDVITAAQRISETGTRLDKLARLIAERCPESGTKRDLLAYLERVALYCHQLDICSRVKAEVSLKEGEVIISALDSATSLVQAAKNLMSAVILTIQASYVASTKYRTRDTNSQPPVIWRKKSTPSTIKSDSKEGVSIGKKIDNIEKEDYLYKDKPLFLGINQEIKVIKEFINHYI